MKINRERVAEIFKGRKGAVAIACVIYCLALGLSFTPIHEKIEFTLYDIRFRLKPQPVTMPDLVLIDIDDASIATMGQYPWPRSFYSRALDTMSSAGLGRVLFDMQFMDYSPALVDRDSLRAVLDQTNAGRRISSKELLTTVIDNDAELAHAVKKFGRALVPFSFAKTKLVYSSMTDDEKKQRIKSIRLFTELSSVPVPEGKSDLFKKLIDPEKIDIQYPIPPVISAAYMCGYVDSDPDSDGTARHIRLVRVFDGRIYFHLAFSAYLDMCGVHIKDVEINPGKNIIVKNAFNPRTGLRGDIVIPVDDACRILINWAGDFNGAFEHLPAFALFEYPDIADSVENQLLLKDMAAQNGRSALVDEIAELKTRILAEQDPAKKFLLRKEYRTKISKHQSIIAGYIAQSQKDQQELLKRKKAGEEIDDASISALDDFMSAVKIKTGVDSLFDSIAIMGLTASATQDIGITPLSSEYLMVGTYPNTINTLVNSWFIQKPNPIVNYLLMLIFAVLITVYIQNKSAKRAFVIIGASFVLMNLGYILLFAFAGIWLDQLGANLALILPASAIITVKFSGEEKQKKFIKGAFSKYLSEGVIDQIIKDPESLKLGGDTRTITIFFSDVAGFSSISESLNPEQLVQLLNEYLSEMTDIIMGNSGTVDKYEGDAIMAFWGAPFNFPDHAYLACRSAVEMQRRLADMRAFWRKEGRHELKVRMGLNTGEAVAGNMGSRTRMNYTVMGDSVNLSSRLEGANKFYGTYTMASENTVNEVRDKFHFRELDVIRVVGKKEPIKVYELIDEMGRIDSAKLEIIEKYNEGLKFFHDRNWQKARGIFRQVLKIDPEDGPSQTYSNRCDEFMKTPPPVKWDGVYTLKSK